MVNSVVFCNFRLFTLVSAILEVLGRSLIYSVILAYIRLYLLIRLHTDIFGYIWLYLIAFNYIRSCSVTFRFVRLHYGYIRLQSVTFGDIRVYEGTWATVGYSQLHSGIFGYIRGTGSPVAADGGQHVGVERRGQLRQHLVRAVNLCDADRQLRQHLLPAPPRHPAHHAAAPPPPVTLPSRRRRRR